VVLTSVRHKNLNGAPSEHIDGIRHYRTLRPQTPRRQPLAEMYFLRQRILEVARIERVDLIHAHSPILTGLPGWMAARQLGLGCVYEIRSPWEDAAVEQGRISERSTRYRLTRGAETFLTRRVDAVVCICDGLRSDVGRRGLSAERLHVVPNGVDIARFVPRPSDDGTRMKLGLQNRTVVGYVGTFFGFEGWSTSSKRSRD
jgi:glycosyltransferase involved in cell wall biosynthesis